MRLGQAQLLGEQVERLAAKGRLLRPGSVLPQLLPKSRTNCRRVARVDA